MTLLTRERERAPRSERPIDSPTSPSEIVAPTTIRASYQDKPPAASSEQSAETSSFNGSIFIVPGFEISFSEANQVLQEYMATMIPEFPFVPLPSKNSSDMLKDKPLLLKVILWVCRPRRRRLQRHSKAGSDSTLQTRLLF